MRGEGSDNHKQKPTINNLYNGLNDQKHHFIGHAGGRKSNCCTPHFHDDLWRVKLHVAFWAKVIVKTIL